LAVLSLSGDMGSEANTQRLLQWLLSWVVALEPAQLNTVNADLRKTGHVLAYGFLGFLWFRAFLGQARYGPWRSCIWSLGICLGFALLDEGHQWFCSSRGASLWDVLLDMSGVSLAVVLAGAFWTPGSRTAAAVLRAGRQTIGPE
jgi:VanZ family protein